MADIKQAAIWVDEGKIVARRGEPNFQYKSDVAEWLQSYRGRDWTRTVTLFSSDILAEDWEIVRQRRDQNNSRGRIVAVEQIQYNSRVYTKDIVDFLIKQQDQVSTTHKIADAVAELAPLSVVREALERLRKVDRVAEIAPNMWHLE